MKTRGSIAVYEPKLKRAWPKDSIRREQQMKVKSADEILRDRALELTERVKANYRLYLFSTRVAQLAGDIATRGDKCRIRARVELHLAEKREA